MGAGGRRQPVGIFSAPFFVFSRPANRQRSETQIGIPKAEMKELPPQLVARR
jgi:hypothetical protein